MNDERRTDSESRELMRQDGATEARAVAFNRTRLGAETPVWEQVETEQLADCRVFKVRRDCRRNPQTGTAHDFFCLDSSDWINIVPLTEKNEVVMIEQYRHGTNSVTLEIPGGMVDEGETPREAALREMLEETGYCADESVLLGRTHPNPAIQSNWIYTYLAPNVRFERAPVFDSTEHTTVRLVPLADIPALIRDGIITHSLVVVGFHLLDIHLRVSGNDNQKSQI